MAGPLAQLAEHLTFNERVAGSSPARLTSRSPMESTPIPSALEAVVQRHIDDFRGELIEELSSQNGCVLQTVKPDEISLHLDEEWGEAFERELRQRWEAERTAVLELLKERLPEIEQFVQANLEFEPSSGILGRTFKLLAVHDLKIVTIDSVDLPLPTEKTATVSITAYVIVAITEEVEGWVNTGLVSLADVVRRNTFTVGERAKEREREVRPAIKFHENFVRKRVVDVEITATRDPDGHYSEIQFASVKFNPSRDYID
jgi:hypothetical protein